MKRILAKHGGGDEGLPLENSGARCDPIQPTMSPRPTTLKEIAQRSDSIADFGRHLRDWLHELRRVSSRPQAALTIAEEPPRLREKFAQGHIADAWLAAYAEHLAGRIGAAAPEWAFAAGRACDEPSFDEGSTPPLRALALAYSPLAFKRRNVFTPAVDLPLARRAGRPTKSAAEKLKTNAERQRRFRKARRDELNALRKLARKSAKRRTS